MPNERNELDPVPPDCCPEMTLNILDIVRFLKELKLEYLGDELATEIVVNYNANVDESYYIEGSMNGAEIREQFNKLPNIVKQTMLKKVIICDDSSKDFFTQIIKNSTEQYDFFVKDSEVKGSLINTASVVIIISCLLIAIVYHHTASFRGEIGNTISAKIGNVITDYINSKFE